MLKKPVILLLLLTFTSFCIQAQLISISKENFLSDFEKVMSTGKNTLAIAQFNTFKENYNGFSPDQQDAFVKLTQTMASRGHKIGEYYKLLELYNAIATTNLAPEQLVILTSSLNKTIANQTVIKSTETFIKLKDFIVLKTLGNYKFNKLYLNNGDFAFNYYDKKNDYFTTKTIQPSTAPKNTKEEDFGLFDDWGVDADDDNTDEDPWDNPTLEIKPNSYEYLIKIPQISGLIIEIKNADITFVTESDSVTLYQTNGALDLINEIFVGEKGTMDWQNVFIPEAKAFFDKYSFKSNNPSVKIENATFTFPPYVTDSIKGVFEFTAGKRNKNEVSTYPRFKSYQNEVKFDMPEHNIELIGGMALVGNRIFSNSVFGSVSTLWVNKNLPNAFKVEGKRFEITDSLITSNQVSFTTYIQKDSIYHPAVKFRYEPKTKQLNLNKVNKGGFRTASYSDTFHQMDIRVDALSWNLNEGEMDFHIVAGKSEVPAVFESFNYFNPGRLRTLSDIAGFNPLIFIGNYIYRKRKNEFTIEEIQKILQKDASIVANGILVATQMGFFQYNPHKNTYALSRMGFHYYESALGKRDYDDLVLSSVATSDNKNALLDRETNSLDIQGAQDFRLSDSLGIKFLPKDQSMKLDGSKKFAFSGQIIVKNYRFVGQFEVDYDKFLVKLNTIDSISFIPIEIFNKGGKAEIGGYIKYNGPGVLYLNSPDNKSGRKKLEQYPRLEIPGGAVAKFNNYERKQFRYPEEVEFVIPTINQDSLNSIDMSYAGIFKSGGIFKPLNEELTVMPDTSIGFVHFPKGPYQLYNSGTNINFGEPLKMTKRGLVSNGQLSHLAASLNFEKIRFETEKLIGNGSSGKINESFQSKVYYPQVIIPEFTATLLPKQDSLLIKADEEYNFYMGSTKLSGELLVRKTGLFGLGTLKRQDSETASRNIKFNEEGFIANKANFRIKADNEGATDVLAGKNVDVNFDIKKYLVNVSPIDAEIDDTLASSIVFPNAGYETTIDNATWNIRSKQILMKGEVDKSRFTATNKDQYRLSFNGAQAQYDISTNKLNISEIPGINTVDAIIIPEKGEVSISNGKIAPLSNATVIADTLNKYHTLANANITINSKLSYTGDAFYQFVNVSQDTFKIKMGSFEFAEIAADGSILSTKKDGRLSTIARSKILETDSVYLSPKMLYKGDISMLAPFKNLSLKGAIKPILPQYPILGSSWISYSGNKSEAISINIDESLKDGGKRLYAGIHMRRGAGSDALYPTFLSAKKVEDDFDIFQAYGVLTRNETNKTFVIDQPEKKNEKGDVFELYDDDGYIKVDGKIALTSYELDKMVETYGQMVMELDSLETNLSVMMKYNMALPPPLIAKMGENIVKANLDAGNTESAIFIDSPEFMSRVARLSNIKDANDYQKMYQKGHVPLFKVNPKFFSTILFSNINFKYNPLYNSFYSTGNIAIANIGETDINAQIPGYVEVIRSPRRGDEIYIFLEISLENWYYLGYKNGELSISSSDYDINKILTDKDKPSTSKDLTLINADPSEAIGFKKRFMQTYLGITEEAPKRGTINPSQIEQVKDAPPAATQPENKKTPAVGIPSTTTTTPTKQKPVEEDGF